MTFQRAILTSCRALPGYRLWIHFDDGLEGNVDLSDLVAQGFFGERTDWEVAEFFNKAYIDPKTQTVTWEGELDLDPYVLRDKVLQI